MSKQKPVAVALGTALAGLTLSGAAFAMQPLAQGYMLAVSEPGQEAAKAEEGKCGEGKCGIAHVDTDKDGRISRDEFLAAHPHASDRFDKIDTNQDGYIDEAEYAAHHAGTHGTAKAGEGKCGGEKADKAADAKTSEGKCGEGKCGEGKCGGMA